MIFGEKLKNERKNNGWSQEELAERLFVSRQSVSKWENGQNYPSIEIIIKLSDLFGLTIDDMQAYWATKDIENRSLTKETSLTKISNYLIKTVLLSERIEAI